MPISHINKSSAYEHWTCLCTSRKTEKKTTKTTSKTNHKLTDHVFIQCVNPHWVKIFFFFSFFFLLLHFKFILQVTVQRVDWTSVYKKEVIVIALNSNDSSRRSAVYCNGLDLKNLISGKKKVYYSTNKMKNPKNWRILGIRRRNNNLNGP